MACDNFLMFPEPAIGSNLKMGSNQPKGETKDADPKHKDAMELKTFEFGAENPTTIGSATGGAGPDGLVRPPRAPAGGPRAAGRVVRPTDPPPNSTDRHGQG